MQIGQCKLCLKHKELCRESHIIPRFMYKHISGDNNELVFIDAQRAAHKFNSEYEGNILCQDCDSGIIGKLDDYFAKFIHGEFPSVIQPRFERMDDRDIIVRENDPIYDYSRFKLFLLSLLWRTSISSRPIFRQIKLPLEVEEDLRQRTLNKQPGEPDLYACFIHLPPITTDQQGRTGFHTFYMPTMSPIYMEKGDLKMCEFIIEGVHYYYIISRPSNMNVEPAVDKNKLTLAFSTIEDQSKLIDQIVAYAKSHKRK